MKTSLNILCIVASKVNISYSFLLENKAKKRMNYICIFSPFVHSSSVEAILHNWT